MTTEQRIDRLEALAESTLLSIQRLATQQGSLQQETRADIQLLTSQQEIFQQEMQRIAQQHETFQQEMQRIAQQQQADHQEMRTNIRDVVSMITTLAESADEDRAIIREMQREIREMQSEVRGLQTENRRILDHLLNDEDLNQ
jgi:uncharacterized coiled-coil DUF342 family protein